MCSCTGYYLFNVKKTNASTVYYNQIDWNVDLTEQIFWIFFLSIFDNLCRLIAGFIKKETAEQRLKNNLQQPQEYTYLLRFSDKVITDGQGQNLCGAISATVLYKNQKGITFKEICNLEFDFLWIIRIYEYTIFVGIFNLGID